MRTRVIDSHTEGEPTRVVIDGGPIPSGDSVEECAASLARDHDPWRRSLVLEPRGSDVLVGALLVPPRDPDADLGVIFVNNAGILKMVDFTRGEESDLDDLWQVNVKGPFRLIRAALPHLKASGRGRVVSIASTDAKRYRDASVSLGYVMTKQALLAMTHAVRFAGWEDGLRGTAICPGAIDTQMIDGIPGVTPKAERLQPDTVAEIVSLVLALPNQASVPEIVANTRLESTL